MGIWFKHLALTATTTVTLGKNAGKDVICKIKHNDIQVTLRYDKN